MIQLARLVLAGQGKVNHVGAVGGGDVAGRVFQEHFPVGFTGEGIADAVEGDGDFLVGDDQFAAVAEGHRTEALQSFSVAAGDQLVLMGLDTEDNKGERVILGNRQSYVKPLLTPSGQRIVFSTRPQAPGPEVFIVNFDGGPNSARLIGQMIDVRITQALPHSLRGEVLLREPA